MKTHEELKKIAFLRNWIYLIYSRGWQKGPPPGTLRVKQKFQMNNNEEKSLKVWMHIPKIEKLEIEV